MAIVRVIKQQTVPHIYIGWPGYPPRPGRMVGQSVTWGGFEPGTPGSLVSRLQWPLSHPVWPRWPYCQTQVRPVSPKQSAKCVEFQTWYLRQARTTLTQKGRPWRLEGRFRKKKNEALLYDVILHFFHAFMLQLHLGLGPMTLIHF